MPLPTPRSGQTEKEFISQCAGNDFMNSEFPDQKQRVAVCYSQWRKHKVKKAKKQLVYKALKVIKCLLSE